MGWEHWNIELRGHNESKFLLEIFRGLENKLLETQMAVVENNSTCS